jgi:hypothetical protein
VSAAPFVASGYGLLYGRLNLETTHPRIKLSRLPKAFHGFRIAQLSDIHVGPFMSAEEIRKYVAIVNETKADLILLTGDFITWDADTQEAVVGEHGSKPPMGSTDAWAIMKGGRTRKIPSRNCLPGAASACCASRTLSFDPVMQA